jgi:hypothetical protein
MDGERGDWFEPWPGAAPTAFVVGGPEEYNGSPKSLSRMPTSSLTPDVRFSQEVAPGA